MFLLTVFIICCLSSSLQLETAIVSTLNGLIRGRAATTYGENKPYFAFEGIPFAEPPIGALRFEPPVPKSNWSRTLDATEPGMQCMQFGPPDSSEDCLTLNVYVPQTPRGDLPVFVFLPGGFFIAGNATAYIGAPDYFLNGGVIVVTLNYRLGIFGFLATGDLVVPGNNGLKDQLLGLQWTRDNIGAFGGDAGNVTLGGCSAGAASAAYHLHSEASQGLFQKLVLQSGVSLALWARDNFAKALAVLIAQVLALDTSCTTAIVQGLRQVEAQTLLQTATTISLLVDGLVIKELNLVKASL